MLAFLKNLNYKKIAEFVVVIIVAVALFAAYEHYRGPNVIVKEVPGAVDTKLVYVDRPVLIPSTVKPYVIDQATAAQIFAENAKLQQQVMTLNQTVAELKTTGFGKLVYVDKPVPGATNTVREATFDDGRLLFHATDDKANYALTQKFEIDATSGRDRTGKPVTAVKGYEIWPGETRTAMTNVKVVSIVATPTGKSWFVGVNVQAGFGATWDTNAKNANGGVVGLQWLKRGYTAAAEDSVFSLGTPVVFVSANSVKLGILPVSVNLGRVPKQPFKDIWLSPLVGRNIAGIVVTATF